MTITEALKKLAAARKKEAQGRKARQELQTWLYFKGVDLYGAKAREVRNKIIYKKYLQGIPFKIIAESTDVTAERCRLIAQREDHLAKKKALKK